MWDFLLSFFLLGICVISSASFCNDASFFLASKPTSTSSEYYKCAEEFEEYFWDSRKPTTVKIEMLYGDDFEGIAKKYFEDIRVEIIGLYNGEYVRSEKMPMG